MENHLLSNIEILYGIEEIILGRGQRNAVSSDKGPCEMEIIRVSQLLEQ